jgi:hypothetical protein
MVIACITLIVTLPRGAGKFTIEPGSRTQGMTYPRLFNPALSHEYALARPAPCTLVKAIDCTIVITQG